MNDIPMLKVRIQRDKVIHLTADVNLRDGGIPMEKLCVDISDIDEAIEKARSEKGSPLRAELAEEITRIAKIDTWLKNIGRELQSRSEKKVCRVRLFIDKNLPELSNLPWEALDWPGYLGLEPTNVWFSRQGIVMPKPSSLRGKKPKVLLAVAKGSPDSLNKYNLPKIEDDLIVELYRRMNELGRVDLSRSNITSDGTTIYPASLKKIEGKLRESSGVEVLCLIAHGGQSKGGPCLYLENNENASLIEHHSIEEVIEGLGTQLPPLIMLVSCFSAGSESTPLNRSLAWEWAHRDKVRVQTVLAIHGRIPQEAAITFVAECIEQLSSDEHSQIDKAVAYARASKKGEDSWAQPILYMQVDHGRVWEPDPALKELMKWLRGKERVNVSFGIDNDPWSETSQKRIGQIAEAILDHGWYRQQEPERVQSYEDLDNLLCAIYQDQDRDIGSDQSDPFWQVIRTIYGETEWKRAKVSIELCHFVSKYRLDSRFEALSNNLFGRNYFTRHLYSGRNLNTETWPHNDIRSWLMNWGVKDHPVAEHPFLVIIRKIREEFTEADIHILDQLRKQVEAVFTEPRSQTESSPQPAQPALNVAAPAQLEALSTISPEPPPKEVDTQPIQPCGIVFVVLIHESFTSPGVYDTEFWAYDQSNTEQVYLIDYRTGTTSCEQIKAHIQYLKGQFRVDTSVWQASWPDRPHQAKVIREVKIHHLHEGIPLTWENVDGEEIYTCKHDFSNNKQYYQMNAISALNSLVSSQ